MSFHSIHNSMETAGTTWRICIKNMVDAKVNLTDPKMLIITAAMLVLGLGGASFSVGNFTLSGLGLSAIVGILLNLILNFSSFKTKTTA